MSIKREDVLVDQGKMYALTKDRAGQLFLEVVVGGFAMENVVIPLSNEEQTAYETQGKPMLDDLAFDLGTAADELV